MNWLIGLGACLLLGLFVAVYVRVSRLSAEVAGLKDATRVEPNTVQIGNARAFHEQLAYLSARETFPILAGRVELVSPTINNRHRALAALRAIAVRGADEIFAEGDGFWVLIGGRLNPFRVGGYFLGELHAHHVHALCSWAYTGSADPSVRAEIQAVALKGVGHARERNGLAVNVLGSEAWQDVGPGGGAIAPETVAERRANSGLTRLEFASLVGVTLDQVVAWETGRECEVELSDQLTARLTFLEKAIAATLQLRESAKE